MQEPRFLGQMQQQQQINECDIKNKFVRNAVCVCVCNEFIGILSKHIALKFTEALLIRIENIWKPEF